jgi:FkbM family methyltransferase
MMTPMFLKLHYLHRAYRYRLRVDPAELRFVCSQLKAGDVAADVGCHKGAYTYWMRRSVGAQGAVFAFEPQPQQVEYLRRAFSAMEYDNVAVVPMAVSDACGKLPLYTEPGVGFTHAASLVDPPSRGGPAAKHLTATAAAVESLLVDVITLDDFFARQDRGPNFLKIDVEGHERSVLEGAHGTLERYRPALLIECENRHRPDGDVGTVFSFLHSFGYEGSFFLNGTRRSLTEFDPSIHQRIEPGATSTPRGYVNNFAFVHESARK